MKLKAPYTFKVRSYECGPDGLVTLPNICNYLQEAASLNAEKLGFSKSDFAAEGANISWVLTRLVVKMRRYPKWEDEVTVETFPRGGRKIVAWRDFAIRDAAGETLGVASSEWMLIDLQTRKLVPIPETVIAAVDAENEPVLGLEPFSRFKYPAAAVSGEPIALRALKSDIDLNGHVNNVRYLNWMFEPCADMRPAEMEVVFRSETLAGESVRIDVATVDGVTYHRVCDENGHDHLVAKTLK